MSAHLPTIQLSRTLRLPASHVALFRAPTSGSH